jgi:aminoglycoside 6'-N-acetyltransferase I
VEREDQPEWMRMRKKLWPECPEEKHQEEIASILDNKAIADEVSTAAFVYERKPGRLGGFIEVSIKLEIEGFETSPIGYIEGWYIDADIRNQGIGKLLVERFEEWARCNGFSEVGSDSELDNSVSIAIHRRLGYRDFGISEEGMLFRKVLM